jgi:hypothetical protein
MSFFYRIGCNAEYGNATKNDEERKDQIACIGQKTIIKDTYNHQKKS